MVAVRNANARDAEAITAIWNLIIRDTAITFNSVEKSESELAELIESAPCFLVAQDQERIFGFAFFSQFRGGIGYARTMELSIHLAEDVRGRGIGLILMRELERQAIAQDVGSLWAGVAGENPGSVAFHEKCGFETVASLPKVGYKFGRWMDLTLMRKDLP